MKTYGPKLPKGTDLARVIERHVEREESALRRRMLRWLIAYYYAMGYRRFDLVNPWNATVAAYELNKDGTVPVQVQEMLSIMGRVTGQFMALDLMPDVNRQGNALSAIRDRAVAEILLNSGVSKQQIEMEKEKQALCLSLLGCCGLHMNCVDSATVGLTLDPEIVHPSELLPFPSVGLDLTKVRGRMRTRYIDMNRLKEVFGNGVSRKKDEMDWATREIGDLDEAAVATTDELQASRSRVYTSLSGDKGESNNKQMYEAVRIRELWLDGPRNTVSRYCVTSGDAVIHDEEYTVERYHPLHIMRYGMNGGYWGYGLFDLLLSVAREFEKCVTTMVNSTYDLDNFPVVLIPSGALNERKIFNRGDRNLKFATLSLEARYSGGGDFRPLVINPPVNDQPGRTASFLSGILDKYNPVPDLIRQKGRGESLPFMQFLDEEARKPTSAAVQSIISAWSSAYQYACNKLTMMVVESPRPVPVTHVTLGLAGAVIDWNKNSITFSDNPIPDVSRLSFGVMEQSPRATPILKAEAMLMLQVHQDLDRFILTALEEGLDFPMWMNQEQAAYDTVKMDILSLYNDGETPGEIVISPNLTLPRLQLRVLDSFMASPVLRAASVDIINVFQQYKTTLMTYMGEILPEPVPDPYEDAIVQSRLMQMQQQQPQPAGRPALTPS